jgi:hypothetical protein
VEPVAKGLPPMPNLKITQTYILERNLTSANFVTLVLQA